MTALLDKPVLQGIKKRYTTKQQKEKRPNLNQLKVVDFLMFSRLFFIKYLICDQSNVISLMLNFLVIGMHLLLHLVICQSINNLLMFGIFLIQSSAVIFKIEAKS